MIKFLTSPFGLKDSTVYKIAKAIEYVLYGITAIGIFLNFGPGLLLEKYSQRAHRLGGPYYEQILEIIAFIACMIWLGAGAVLGILYCTMPYFIAQFIFVSSFLTAAAVEIEFQYSEPD